MDRLINKFVENDFEKVDRMIELHEKYFNAVKEFDKTMEKSKKKTSLSDEEIYLERLDAGLFTLQLVDLSITYAAISTPSDGKDTGV